MGGARYPAQVGEEDTLPIWVGLLVQGEEEKYLLRRVGTKDTLPREARRAHPVQDREAGPSA